jgi:NADH dehydrogenase
MIFVAGATGFVGGHLLQSLKESTEPVRCLVRDEKKAEWLRARGVEAVLGDILDPASLGPAVEGADTIVHLVGIIAEAGGLSFDAVHVRGTENLVRAASASGARRFFYQSALGADRDSPYRYLQTKAQAEETLLSSKIPCTIFRPSLIVGSGDGFTIRTKQLISAGPVVPVPGRGLAKFQPIYIADWVRCFHAVLTKGDFENETFELGGPEQLTYLEILQEIMEVLKVRKKIVHVPTGLMRASLPFMGAARSLASALGREIPEVTSELLSLLDEDNICESDTIEKHFGFSPVRFADALREYL